MLEIIRDQEDNSHVDHIDSKILDLILERYKDANAFFIEQIEMPEGMTIECKLYGPIMGDAPVRNEDVIYVQRPERKTRGISWPTRIVNESIRPTRILTVIAGPHKDEATGKEYECVLYTCYGGPLAPQEPGDPDIKPEKIEESKAFWAEHALSSI